VSAEEDQLDIIEELKKSPSPFAQTVINEIKALRDNNVLLRLDRDNWRNDYQKERDLADELYDVVMMEHSEPNYAEKYASAVNNHRARRRG
jgi:hypothetical protein